MKTSHLGLAKLAIKNLKTLLQNKLSDKQFSYRTIFGSYALFLMLLALRDNTYIPNDEPHSNEAVHPVQRPRSFTWSVSRPTQDWFDVVKTIKRARSASTPLLPNSITGQAVAGRRLSVSTLGNHASIA